MKKIAQLRQSLQNGIAVGEDSLQTVSQVAQYSITTFLQPAVELAKNFTRFLFSKRDKPKKPAICPSGV